MMTHLPSLLPEQRDADEGAVLVAVADDQGLGVRVHGERREQLGLAAGLEAEMICLAGIDDLLDDLAQLVHLDREDAAIMALVADLVDRAAERLVDRLDAVAQQILEADDERKSEPASARLP